MSEERLTADEFHQKCAKSCFNGCWSILDQPQRSAEDEAHLLDMAHASLFHWRKVGEAVHCARGEWLLARVNAVLARGEAAVAHGRRCLDLAETNDLSAFDRAEAHEAIARGLALLGDADGAREHLRCAFEIARDIHDAEDRAMCEKDLHSVPLPDGPAMTAAGG